MYAELIFKRATTAVVTLLVAVWATIDIRRSGWLDRMVQYKKELFISDVNKLAPVKIKATIIPKPKGYKDSNYWDFNSVVHLLILLKHSENAAPVQRVLRRAFMPSRRLMMSMADSFKHFPSIAKETLNDFYYDAGSAEDYEEEENNRPDLESGVIVVTNPVEARLPSTQISIKLLKDILMARAIAARELPTTSKPPIPWIPMNKTYPSPGDDAGGGEAGGATTVAGTAADAGGGGEGGETTAAAADGAEPEAEAEAEAEAEPEAE